MKKTKRDEVLHPKVEIGHKYLLGLYLAGVTDFAFIGEAARELSQEKSGAVWLTSIGETKIQFIKKGRVVILKELSANPSREIASNLLVKLMEIVTKKKTAVDISTAA